MKLILINSEPQEQLKLEKKLTANPNYFKTNIFRKTHFQILASIIVLKTRRYVYFFQSTLTQVLAAPFANDICLYMLH